MGNYKWLVNIESELWQSALDNDEKKLLLSKILKNCPLTDMRMLHSDYVEGIIMNDFDLLDLYTRIELEDYPAIARPEYLKTSPDVTSDILEESVKSESLNQVGKISQIKFPPQCLYVTAKCGKQGRLSIQKDGKTTKDDIEIIPAAPTCLKEFAENAKPKLNQGDKPRHNFLGNSYDSSFKAYDPRNLTPAENLLQTAFENYVNNYTGNDRNTSIPAQYLYAWDQAHNCYVQFRHNRNNEYHGMDIELSNLPDDVRKFYENELSI